jgi:hypothetical protein
MVSLPGAKATLRKGNYIMFRFDLDVGSFGQSNGLNYFLTFS